MKIIHAKRMIVMIAIMLAIVPTVLYAQDIGESPDSPTSGGGGNNGGGSAPLDGGILTVIAAGAGLAYKKARDNRRARRQTGAVNIN